MGSSTCKRKAAVSVSCCQQAIPLIKAVWNQDSRVPSGWSTIRKLCCGPSRFVQEESSEGSRKVVAQTVVVLPSRLMVNCSSFDRRIGICVDMRYPVVGPRSQGVTAFIPIYPNKLPTVPKPSRTSRRASLVVNNLPASQGAITRLENR